MAQIGKMSTSFHCGWSNFPDETDLHRSERESRHNAVPGLEAGRCVKQACYYLCSVLSIFHEGYRQILHLACAK